MKFPAIALALTLSWYLMESHYNRRLEGNHSYECIRSDDPLLSQHGEYPKIDGAPLWRLDTLAVFDNPQDCDQAQQFMFFYSQEKPGNEGEGWGVPSITALAR